MASSLTADRIIAKARECYELGLITEERLEFVTQQAETETGYNPIMDLPFDWKIEAERSLRRAAARRARRLKLRHRIRRAFGLG